MRSVVLVLAVAMHGAPALAGLIRIPADFPTIAAGLGAAASGDTVEVACGTYHEHDLVLAPDVTLRSATRDPACVTIDADDLGRVIRYTGPGPSAIEGLTITDGRGVDMGGGMHATQGDLAVRRCDFLANAAVGEEQLYGGAIYANSVTLELTDCSFAANSAGGGVFVSSGRGGALYAVASTVTVECCRFTDNAASAGTAGSPAGGAIAVSSCVMDVEDAVFERNWASSGHSNGNGGGISASGSSTRLAHCSFLGNFVGYGAGGAVLLAGGAHEVSGCAFERNRAISGSPALGVANGADVVVRNSTVVRNAGESQISASSSARLAMERCIVAFGVWGSSVIEYGGAVVSLSCTDLHGNPVDWDPSIVDQQGINGNFSADPLFCDLDAGDLHVRWGSPCLPSISAGCGLVGAFGACGTVALEPLTWARLKASWR